MALIIYFDGRVSNVGDGNHQNGTENGSQNGGTSPSDPLNPDPDVGDLDWDFVN